MRNCLPMLLCVAALAGFGASAADQAAKPERLTVHGRLRYYNGTPTARIWVVGTKRILGVRDSDGAAAPMPKELRDLMSWDRAIFADFTVEPLTPSKPGVMQMVRVISASKIVVTEQGNVVLIKDAL